ncbi:VOC family protein [Streptococcus downei]|uniref:Glyoxalase n=1 Tax=Streptococcus downei MFe28 TaxID=764290 RepID=A0A380JEL5_STRDO|nr:VOC family protein [Streptococcus downei]EFQ57298.1 glyoxalase family protein [Streptococcus downei F0415]SUN36550.1 glyoxalase [Streptococcus downei MFe28]
MYDYQSRIRLGRVVLNVANLDLQTRFYKQVLGLAILDRGQGWVNLGIKDSGLDLLRLEEVPASEVEAYGLYHFAILLPSRSDLGDFLRHALVNNVPLQGASDHGYSEAIYLNDTEGNGIEIYRNKPVPQWDIQGDKILGITEEMDGDGVLASAHGDYAGYQMPAGTKMGHFHYSVSNAAKLSAFYRHLFEIKENQAFSTASWIADGGYHHHFAFNHWAGPGLAKRSQGLPGLNHVQVFVKDSAYLKTIEERARALKSLLAANENDLLIEDIVGNRIVVELEKSL